MSNSVEMEKIIKSSLYADIPLDEDMVQSLVDYFDNRNFNNLSVDLYCPLCGEKSTFKPYKGFQIPATSYVRANAFLEKKIPFGMLYYCCARDCNHVFFAQLFYDDVKKTIRKIGQNPSVADIDAPEFNKFKKVLPEDKLADLKKSSGLASHGIGAGSFVYLRRVIEYLLMSAYNTAEKEGAIDADAFMRAHVVERIKMLKDYLPEEMVENASVYGILSKGVHELDEKTCIGAYSLMRETIVMILDGVLVKKEMDEKRKKLKSEISRVAGQLKGDS